MVKTNAAITARFVAYVALMLGIGIRAGFDRFEVALGSAD